MKLLGIACKVVAVKIGAFISMLLVLQSCNASPGQPRSKKSSISASESMVPVAQIFGGTPKDVKEGFCGDGIINGTNEDCDLGAIQNTNCGDYGGISGVVRCQTNCLYDFTDCMTRVVDKKVGGLAETCKCIFDSTACRGTCQPSNGFGQSMCFYECDNAAVCQCEEKLRAQMDHCELRCSCLLDVGGFPTCECVMDDCQFIAITGKDMAALAQ